MCMSSSKAPAYTPPPDPPQPARSPEVQAVASETKGMGQAGGSGGTPGAAQTMLTGPGGVDPKTLLLGKNTLLGA